MAYDDYPVKKYVLTGRIADLVLKKMLICTAPQKHMLCLPPPNAGSRDNVSES